MAEADPQFTDGKDAQGQEISAGTERRYFDSGDRLKILAVESDMQEKEYAGGFKSVNVSLTVEDQSSHAQAKVVVPVYTFWIKHSQVVQGLVDNVWFSLRPVKDDGFPHIGESRNDLICRDGSPDRTNSDEVGGDQLVYYGGKMLVYLSPKTDRVTNVQSSFD